jgi:hypothetical protein
LGKVFLKIFSFVAGVFGRLQEVDFDV